MLHRKTHCSFFNLSHYSYSHSSCQVRLLVKPPKKAHLTTNHRRISADTSKQGNTSTVSTTGCSFQWHAIQNGLAINYLEAGENIKGNSLARNKTINGISKWKHLKVDTSWHSVSCQWCFHSSQPSLPSSYWGLLFRCELTSVNVHSCPNKGTGDNNTNTYQEVFTSHLIEPSGSLMKMVLMPFFRQTKAVRQLHGEEHNPFVRVYQFYFLGYGRAVETDVPLWNRFLKQKNNRGVVRVILFRKEILFKM